MCTMPDAFNVSLIFFLRFAAVPNAAPNAADVASGHNIVGFDNFLYFSYMLLGLYMLGVSVGAV